MFCNFFLSKTSSRQWYQEFEKKNAILFLIRKFMYYFILTRLINVLTFGYSILILEVINYQVINSKMQVSNWLERKTTFLIWSGCYPCSFKTMVWIVVIFRFDGQVGKCLYLRVKWCLLLIGIAYNRAIHLLKLSFKHDSFCSF